MNTNSDLSSWLAGSSGRTGNVLKVHFPVQKKPKILMVTTGGTITMLRDANGSLLPCEDSGQLIEKIPELSTLADIDILPLANIDSSNLHPNLWVNIGQAIYQRIKEYDGFIVTHGTDTLCYTASALSFILQELNKPVVLTGAQVPLEEIGSDGRANLINAMRVAISELAEVAVVFGSLIIRGSRAKKTSVFDLQAFTSVNDTPIGNIGLNLTFSSSAKMRSRKKPMLRAVINSNVAMFPIYPGIKPELVSYMSKNHDGIVLEGYGAGNIPNGKISLIPVIEEATRNNVPIVVCTQCIVGSTEMELYQVGRAALEAGAIPAMDMTPETALVKLMWVLGQTDDLNTIDSMMQKSFVGELHEVC